MQDKEFDNLFRSKLDSFEAEPTRQVWLGITEGLDGKRRYRALLPWLGIAASITILAAAGILFIPQKRATSVKPAIKEGIAKTQPAPVKAEPAKTQPKPKAIEAVVKQQVNQVAHTKAKPVNNGEAKVKETVAAPAPAIENVVKHDEQPVLAAVQQKPEPVTPVLPSDATPIITKTVVNDNQAAVQTVAAANVPVVDKQEITQPKPKRKVHGIGGFLNTVIAAVDKRKDKIIEFGNSDDDESSNISAVNLGILKFKNKDK